MRRVGIGGISYRVPNTVARQRVVEATLTQRLPCRADLDPLLRRLFFSELALPFDEAVEPGESRVTFEGAASVYVPVEGLAMVAEAAVELADEVSRDG